MRFYQQPLDQPHRFYCGVDLHARCMTCACSTRFDCGGTLSWVSLSTQVQAL
jgi:hypothetical protein